MLPLTPTSRRYPWGSPTAIPRALGLETDDGRALAEAWYGAYPTGSSVVEGPDGATTLHALVAQDPEGVLGADVVARFGPRLPFLLKLVAADSPLPLEVHPGRACAEAGFAAEEDAGVPSEVPARRFPDPYHRPVLVYALGGVEALSGFRAPRRAAELLDGLGVPLARSLRAAILERPDADGVVAAFASLFDPATRPDAAVVRELTTACAQRLWDGSPSPRVDRTVVALGEEHPGDPAAVAALLLNPVTLRAGEALFIPAGTVHAYVSGLSVQVSAASDSALRLGLTVQPLDVEAALRCLDRVAAPAIRIAPETFYGTTSVYYAPVDDFELSVTTPSSNAPLPLPGRGPRILLCLDGMAAVSGESGTVTLGRGQSLVLTAADGPVQVVGTGRLVQVAVP